MSFQPRAIGILSFLAATILFLTTGCIKYSIPIPHPADSTSSTGTSPASGPFSATLGVTAWTANYYTAYFYQGQGLFQLTGVANGNNGDSTYVVISFRTPFQLNQPISSNGPLDVYYVDWQSTFDWDAGNSSGDGVCYVKVTGYDSSSHTISGSFYGSLASTMPNASYTDTITVKNGAFNLNYIPQP